MKLKIVVLAIFVAAFTRPVFPDWTSFRNGGSSAVENSLPLNWSPSTGISWQLELGGYGQSTPVAIGDHIYVASVVGPMKETCLVQCLSLERGVEIWQHRFETATPMPSNYMVSRAAPTPVADQDGVVVFFESGDIVSLTSNGDCRWHRDLTQDIGTLESRHGLGSSPAQDATHVYVNIEHTGPSYLLAIEKTRGAITWRADRPSGSSWSSPIVVSQNGNSQVVVSSAGSLTAYAASTGDKLWTVEGLAGNSVPSPTWHAESIFVGARLPEFSEEGSVRSNCRVIPGSGSMDPRIAWRAERAICDYASPVAVDRFVYFVNKVGVLHCLDGESGKLHYRQRLAGACWATPVISGNHVYFFAKDGTTEVVEAGEQFKLLSTCQLWDVNSPPYPDSYVENNTSSHAHGSSDAGGRSGGSSLVSWMQDDVNEDGILSGEEIPMGLRPMLSRIDTNGNGALDPAELKAMAESFAARRATAQAGARDPIVYGAIAAGNCLLVRTGTRLYCIGNHP